MISSRITQDDMIKYNYLFGYLVKSREISERNRRIRAEIDEAKRMSKNLKSSNIDEFKEAKVFKISFELKIFI